MSTFGSILKRTRFERNFTQKFLADQLNISKCAISQWETGRKNPKHEHLLRVAALLQLDVNELLRGFLVYDQQIGWSTLKGCYQEYAYLPQYEHEFSIKNLSIVPFVCHEFDAGNYLLFVPGTANIFNTAFQTQKLIVRQSHEIESDRWVAFKQNHNNKEHSFGRIIDEKYLSHGETNERILIDDITIVGQIVQILLNL